MKTIALLCLLCTWATGQTTGTAETKGSCSPANTGSNNTFTITCGIGKEQGAELLRIVNRILANQTDLKQFNDKLEQILTGINDIRQSSAGRRLSDEQKSMLISAMKPFRGADIAIWAHWEDPESYHFAEDFVAVFRAAGFTLKAPAMGADKTGINLTGGLLGGPPLVGLHLQPKDQMAWKKPFVQALARALTSAQIPFSSEYIGNFAMETDFELYIGPKAVK